MHSGLGQPLMPKLRSCIRVTRPKAIQRRDYSRYHISRSESDLGHNLSLLTVLPRRIPHAPHGKSTSAGGVPLCCITKVRLSLLTTLSLLSAEFRIEVYSGTPTADSSLQTIVVENSNPMSHRGQLIKD